MLALASLTVAFTVASVTPCPTDAVYAIVPDTNAGVSVTLRNESALRLASEDLACVTMRARQFEQFSQILLGCGALGSRASKTLRTSTWCPLGFTSRTAHHF